MTVAEDSGVGGEGFMDTRDAEFNSTGQWGAG